MKALRKKPPSRRDPRPARIPPPLTRGNERFEGSSVLGEIDGELGILLWQSLRNVMLWTAIDPGKRKGLFSEGAAERRQERLLAVNVAETLRSPLAVLARLLTGPAGADRKRISAACQRIAEWAKSEENTATALAYMQAAALSSPDARLSYEVGLLARQRGEYPRAETWLRRAVFLGRQAGDWESYAQAFLGLGNLNMLRGNLSAAQRSYLRSYRVARRTSLRTVMGTALQHLFAIARERGQVERADDLVMAALKAYGKGHSRLPTFALEVADFWLDRGAFGSALAVLDAVAPHFRGSPEEPAIFVNSARAAAEIDDPARFEEAWSSAWEIISAAEPFDQSVPLYVALAESAARMDNWQSAELAAERAAELAEERGEPSLSTLTAETRAAVRERRVRAHADSLGGISPPHISRPDLPERLAAALPRPSPST